MVDTASSNNVAISYLKKRMKIKNGLVLGGEYMHMKCCAHILNLIVSDGLKNMHSSISTIHNTSSMLGPHHLGLLNPKIVFNNPRLMLSLLCA